MIQTCIMNARVQPPSVDMVKAPPPSPPRNLNPAEAAQVGLLFRVARAKFGLTDIDPLAESPTPATAVAATAPAVKEGARKVKMNQVIDQGDEGEIPQLQHEVYEEMHKVLVSVKGGPVQPEHEPSVDQMCAMRVRILDFKMSPYADFALFTPFHLRHLKHLKFKNHVLQPDGTFKTVEVPGPPSYDAWYASWRVFENTLLMIRTKDAMGVPSPIVTQAALDDYRENFRSLVSDYPESWHLCVVAEDRNRAENFDRIRRKAEQRFLVGLEPEFKPHMPWDFVFRAAAHDRDYWSKHVRDPAMIFLATGGKRKLDPTGSATSRAVDRDGEDGVPKKKKPRKVVVPVLPSFPPPPKGGGKGKGGEKGKGKMKGKLRGQDGLFLQHRDGTQICFAYQKGECNGVCPKGRAHVCQQCLGGHPLKNCRNRPDGRNM